MTSKPTPRSVSEDSAIVINSDTALQHENMKNDVVLEHGDTDHDVVLEHITDIINSIDDTRRESGAVDGEDSEETYSPCWPRDWLPRDCPGVRVIALNYTTDPFLWRPLWITKRIRYLILLLRQRTYKCLGVLLFAVPLGRQLE